ncbi:MAG: glycerol-3-phosphate dehydrogenase/oxidase [Candidatus Aminicenantes bacterium]|nr:glycerol-3-phosphate dehydrogenase/oxidase [Candidatus Aminicenantes bacterium]MDH5384303.1 glycerol-3-phosphate dehydrogenase/oxidase [Candidatus Aminicenantes bacterium]MDH5742852.1 glycerol-3-phosphate dehydrogenase/oxidase [Candidatus Aminicenantes bacterium]
MKSAQIYHSPWASGWRDDVWARLDKPWDLIVIGGGITGAGILAVAARCGLRVFLLEKADFASGTSSRSSKMVHGGLRYLKRMQIRLTRESVRERQRLLSEAPGLVEPLGFIYPVYEGDRPSPWLVEVGLGIYTRLASDAGEYRRLDAVDIGMMAPGLKTRNLERGFHYWDAQTDDSRLVLRVLNDGLLAGKGRAAALNYAPVIGLETARGRVQGVHIRDALTDKPATVSTNLVINATGVWADRLRSETDPKKRLRPLRGSHLYFSSLRFPVYQAIAFSHPDDGRPVFAYPWEGITLVGTTDVDHTLSLDKEPSISIDEADYLLRAVQSHFPELELTKEDVLTTQTGIRPVVDTGKDDPSAESRDHVLWPEQGLLTVTGGKLTTFRSIAVDVLREAHDLKKKIPEPDEDTPALDIFDPDKSFLGLDPHISRRLWGRYGAAAPALVDSAPDHLHSIPGTPYLWAELLWAARNEAVCHLDDLLLRRLRLGILLSDGGQGLLPRMKALIQKRLDWDDTRWKKEVERYRNLWQTAHGLPQGWRQDEDGTE